MCAVCCRRRRRRKKCGMDGRREVPLRSRARKDAIGALKAGKRQAGGAVARNKKTNKTDPTRDVGEKRWALTEQRLTRWIR